MYRTPELSSRSFTAFAWCDFIHIILSRGQNGRVLGLGKWSRINRSASAKRIGLPPCHIGIAAAFIQKHQVICLESRHKTVPVFLICATSGTLLFTGVKKLLLAVIILLVEENARQYQC